MQRVSVIALCLSAIFTASCSDNTGSNQASGGQSGSVITQVSASDKLNKVYQDYFNQKLQLDPLFATQIGHSEYNDQLPNFLSPEYRERLNRFEQRYLDRISSIDTSSLTDADLVSYRIFKRDRKMAIRGMKFPEHLLPINQFYNLASRFAILGSGESYQPFNDAVDYRNWTQRLQQLPTLFEQAISNMKAGVERGIVQPRVLIEKAIPQIEAHLVESAEDSIFYQPVVDFPQSISAEQRQRIESQYRQLITDTVLPAYRLLRDYLVNDYLPHTRTDNFGIGQLPSGTAWYQYKIEAHTSTTLSADVIHRIGKTEVARIHDQMRDIMAETNFKGSLSEFFSFMTNDSQFIYPSRDAMLKDYKSLRNVVDERVETLFNIFPTADYEVRPVESFREQSASSGSYQSAPVDNSKPAIFYLNTYDLSSRPTWARTALFLHEAAPGHHFQISIQQELEELPEFRKFGRETAYTEGWGLYAESLGHELGLYQDPYQRFGALAAELWRSIRLVADTGIHSKGWTREQVLDYMYANAPVAEARAVSEAERFMALPGQALAYKIGQLKIAELRREAERKLGDKFDIKEFHRAVLADGAVPLIILEQKMKRWIIERRS